MLQDQIYEKPPLCKEGIVEIEGVHQCQKSPCERICCAVPRVVCCKLLPSSKPPLCKGRWLAVSESEGLFGITVDLAMLQTTAKQDNPSVAIATAPFAQGSLIKLGAIAEHPRIRVAASAQGWFFFFPNNMKETADRRFLLAFQLLPKAVISSPFNIRIVSFSIFFTRSVST